MRVDEAHGVGSGSLLATLLATWLVRGVCAVSLDGNNMQNVTLGVIIGNVILAGRMTYQNAGSFQPCEVRMPNHIRLSVCELNPEGPKRNFVQHIVQFVESHIRVLLSAVNVAAERLSR